MFLKSLTLKGFKSFADSTTLALEPGVTVVVGPNGSGKSNVVDAVAWVLGAQAPKSVRSQKMDDVIFAGTATRPALGRAEVILTIDNAAGLLPVEFSEVTVSRILFRTGESEYSINGVPCRLLDVQELLSDAGVGRQQHVIVSQGQIDAVLNARPEDRRAIIEEAAGVLKYRRRKEKAERRLDATEANLLRVQDLLREVRRQLRPLERQAEAAKRHGELVGELTALKIHVSGREIGGLRVKLRSLAADEIEAHRRERELKSELARLDTSVMSIEAKLAARGDNDVGDRMMRVEQLRERARGLAAILGERRRSIERDRGQLLDAGVVANLEADAARFREELGAVAIEFDRLAPELEQLELDEAAFATQRENASVVLFDDPSGVRAASAAAEVRGELRSMRTAIERSESDLRRSYERTGVLRQRAQALDAEAERLRSECADAELVETPLVAEIGRVESRRRGAEAQLESMTRSRQEVAESASRWSARVEALQQALDVARARAGAERLAGVDGVLGSLLDLIEIDAGWQASVEAALGEALTAVVVDGPDSARRALSALRDSDTSGAILAVGVPPSGRTMPPVGEPVRLHAHAVRPGLATMLDALIGSAVRVADAAAAIEVAISHPDAIVVTDVGDRFDAGCWRVGVASGGTTAAALDHARAESRAADDRLAAAEEAMREAQQRLATAQASESDLATRLDANDARFNVAAEALATVQGERREIVTELESLDRAVLALTEHVAGERARIAELEAVLPALAADEHAEADAAVTRDRVRAEQEARTAVLASRRRDLDVRGAGLHERQQLLDRRLAETELRLEMDAGARAEAASRRLQIERSLGAVDRLTEVVAARREVIDIEHGRLAERRRRHTEEVRSLASALEGYRRERSEFERQLEQVREKAHRLDIEEAEAKLRLETAIDTLRRDLDIEPEVAEAAPAPPVPEGSTPAGRTRELERELRMLGPINPLALEEFTELLQRHTFLEGQLDDVRSTRRDLGRIIKAVDQEIQSVFASAYADVSANFTHLFATLFPGGVGALPLTDPDDLLATGVEIEAKPSGKNVKKLSLLSGGERSLTALAFLFAVFRSRPSPFYVMDEVEAALDDINLHRFLGLVAEFRKEAQLLIVSHQKRTMEAGDSLLGVSMQPGGSSKVVTERVSTPV